jgi:NAD-dependent dihydropyrimidine dehydrogenase PreA subunit
MAVKIDPALCAGCGVCAEACLNGAIYLLDRRAEVDEALCTQCLACIDACPNGAITAISEPAPSMSIIDQPAAETKIIPASPSALEPETPAPLRGLAPLAGAALAFLGREVAPRLVDMLFAALEHRLAQPAAGAITSSSTSSSVPVAGRRGVQRQARYRSGRFGNRNHRGRR